MSLGVSEQRPARLVQWPPAPERLRNLPTVLGLGALAFALLAALEGQLLAWNTPAANPRPWLVAGAVLGIFGVYLLERGGNDIPEPREVECTLEPWRAITARRTIGVLMVAAGALGSAIAAALVATGAPDEPATLFWALGLAAAVAGAALLARKRVAAPHEDSGRGLKAATLAELAIVAGIAAVALWLRMPNLADVPANVHGDEASIGLDARRILAGEMPPVFATGWYDVPALSFAVHADVMEVAGNNLFGLRLGSVIDGLITIVVLYLLARRLWGPRPALIAAAFMAVAAWHIHFSRTGFHYMQAPLALLLTLYFLVLGIQERRAMYWLLAGYAIGLSVEVYFAARLAAPIVAVYLGYLALTRGGFLRMHAPGVLALIFGAALFLAPMAVVFQRNPTAFGARTEGVLVTTPQNLSHELGAYHVETLRDVLSIQLRNTVEAFNIRGETSLQYGHAAPMFDLWTGSLLAVSALGILLRFGSPRAVLLTAWVVVALLVGSVLTVDALFSPRVVVTLPALVLGPALLLDLAWRGLTRLAGRTGTYAFGIGVAAVLAFALVANVNDYFNVQVKQRQPPNRFTQLGYYAQSVANLYQLYAIGTEDWSLTSEAPRFLAPNASAVNIRNGPLELPLIQVPATGGVAFVIENRAPDFAQRLTAIQRTYPRGRPQVITGPNGLPTFTSYLVEHDELVSPGSAE